MVLTTASGGAVGAGRTLAPTAAPERRSAPTGSHPVRWGVAGVGRTDAGSQALEFAMVLPLLGMLLGLLAQTGLLLADVLVVHDIAREVGRTAAVDGDDRARRLAEQLAGGRDVRLDLVDARDGLVAARVELASRAFEAVGVDVWLPARATFRRETPGRGVDGG